jgi:hypothetical protein
MMTDQLKPILYFMLWNTIIFALSYAGYVLFDSTVKFYSYDCGFFSKIPHSFVEVLQVLL